MNMLHMNSSDIVHSDLSEEDIQQFMKKSVCHQCCKLKDNFKVYAGSANIPLNHNSESTLDTRHDTETGTQLKPLISQRNSVEEMSYEFNIPQFLEEKGYQRDKDNFDKNLHLAEGMSSFLFFLLDELIKCIFGAMMILLG